MYEKCKDDGLVVVGVHSPEFGFEGDISNVQEAVRQANIEYPVVLDNNYTIWNAYGQRFWPAWYLVDVDGFIRYMHFGEGAYEETNQKVQELLAERETVSPIDCMRPTVCARSRMPQDGIVGDLTTQCMQCQAVADEAFVVVALP